MNERTWDSKSIMGRIVFNWITFFGMLESPDNICKVIRNGIIGAPLMVLLFSALFVMFCIAVLGFISLPVYLIFGPTEIISIDQAITYVGAENCSEYNNSEQCLVYLNALQEVGNWSYIFPLLIPGVITWGVVIIGSVIKLFTSGIVSFVAKHIPKTGILADIKEAHKDKICFKIKWK